MSPARRRLGLVTGAVLVVAASALGVVRLRQHRATATAGPPSDCRVTASRSIGDLAPDGLALVAPDAVVLGYAANRGDAPSSGVSLASIADGGVASFAPQGEYAPLAGAFVRGTTWAGDRALVSLVNRTAGLEDPSFALVSFWRHGGKESFSHRLVIQASGIAVAPLEQGVVVALTYSSFGPRAGPQTLTNAAGVLWFQESARPPRSVERYVSTNGPLDFPAVAVSASRVALLFLESRERLVLVLVDRQLERVGDPITVATGEIGPPAAAYIGDTLVVVWAQTASGTTRLRVASLAAGASTFAPSRIVSDEPVALTAPAFAPLAAGGSLLAWIRSAADRATVRAARFEPEMSEPFDLGVASSAHALTSMPEPSGSGASIGWLDRTTRSVVVADVACAPRMQEQR